VGPTNNDDFETLSAKFHFVDLAGSERLKRLVCFRIFRISRINKESFFVAFMHPYLSLFV
jgi:hypothetical protein